MKRESLIALVSLVWRVVFILQSFSVAIRVFDRGRVAGTTKLRWRRAARIRGRGDTQKVRLVAFRSILPAYYRTIAICAPGKRRVAFPCSPMS